MREGEFWVQAYYIIGSLEKAATYIVVDAFQSDNSPHHWLVMLPLFEVSLLH